MINILLTKVSGMGAIGWIKSIKAIKTLNITLYGCDSNPYGYSSGSVLVDYFFQSPSTENTNDYKEFLCCFCNKKQIDLLLTVFDDEFELICSISNYIKSKILLPDIDTIHLFRNKQLATIEMEKLGVTVPPEVTSLFDENTVIFRKKTSVGSKGIEIVDLSKERFIPNLFNSNYFLQRFISGKEYTVDVFSDIKGNPKMIIPRERIEIKQGISFKCRIEFNQRLINTCQKIYKKYHLPGITNVQFISTVDKDYFIELNPRIGGTTIASILSSFNYTEQLIKNVLFNVPLNSYNEYMNKVAWGSIISRYYEETILSS